MRGQDGRQEEGRSLLREELLTWIRFSSLTIFGVGVTNCRLWCETGEVREREGTKSNNNIPSKGVGGKR